MIIHEKGPKAERDRAAGLRRYHQLCEFTRTKPITGERLAKLNNQQLYRLGDDLYNSLSAKRRRKFTDWLGVTTGNHLSFGFFLKALIGTYRATGWRKLALFVQAPFRYPGFIARSISSAKSKGLDARTGEPLKKAATA